VTILQWVDSMTRTVLMPCVDKCCSSVQCHLSGKVEGNFFSVRKLVTLRLSEKVKSPIVHTLSVFGGKVECCLVDCLAAEEDGRPDPEVPDPQQPNLFRVEQVPPPQRLRQHAGRARPLLSATNAAFNQLHDIVSRIVSAVRATLAALLQVLIRGSYSR